MRFPITQPVIALVGPTAIGKTELSLKLAEEFNCEILSLDSMQVYRFMDIGTAKATLDERKRVVHHLIDIVNPDEAYDANRYVEDASELIVDIHNRSKIPLLVGGTGLYLQSLVEGLFEGVGEFPDIREKLQRRLVEEGSLKLHNELNIIDCNSAKRIHKNDTHRLLRALEIYYATGESWAKHIDKHSQTKELRFSNLLQLGLTCDRETLYLRINKRTSAMLRAGLQGEVEDLLSRGYHRRLKSMQSIGYRHMIEHLLDGRPRIETENLLARDTRRYAKRQYTWFRKMDIEWFEITEKESVIQTVKSFLQSCR